VAQVAQALTPEQERVKHEFVEVRGTWGPAWEAILRLDAGFLAAYLEFSAVPWRKNHLPDKVKEFIYLAVDAAATHLYEPGIRQHVRAAIAHGATAAEITEVLELTSTLGIEARLLRKGDEDSENYTEYCKQGGYQPLNTKPLAGSQVLVALTPSQRMARDAPPRLA